MKQSEQIPRTTFAGKWWRGEMAEQPLALTIPSLTEWFASPCGKLLLETEQQMLDELLPSLFGYHLLQLSMCEGVDLAGSSPIHHRVALRARPVAPALALAADARSLLVADFDQLPLESDSVDVVILHHALDFSPHPHQILKEVNRVLIPRGHVIIIGFNPYSLFGLWKGVASVATRQPQWRYGSLAKSRLFDWFKLLDLETSQVCHGFFRPPTSHPGVLGRLAFLDKVGTKLGLPLGGVHAVLARKDVCAVTPIRAPWERAGKRLMGIGAAQASPSRLTANRDAQKPRSRRELH